VIVTKQQKFGLDAATAVSTRTKMKFFFHPFVVVDEAKNNNNNQPKSAVLKEQVRIHSIRQRTAGLVRRQYNTQ
jgi:hypothetical protein